MQEAYQMNPKKKQKKNQKKLDIPVKTWYNISKE